MRFLSSVFPAYFQSTNLHSIPNFNILLAAVVKIPNFMTFIFIYHAKAALAFHNQAERVYSPRVE